MTLARFLFALSCLLASFQAAAQIPEQGRFDYVLYDNGDRPVGNYFFSIARMGGDWRIESEMTVDTRFLLLPIRLKDQNSFIHDGTAFKSFEVRYFKDVPLLSTLRLEVVGARSAEGWTVQATRNGNAASLYFPPEGFAEVRNLISRLVRPEAVLRPGEVRTAQSLDPLTLEVGKVESRGIAIESVAFQGRPRELFVMETRAPDGNVTVKKFANGLIYLSRTAEGYALLKAAQLPGF